MSEKDGKRSGVERKYPAIYEAVRLRPGMYFGGIDGRAMLTAIFYVLEYGLDAASRELCDYLELTLQNDNTVVIKDNGPGLSIESDTSANRSIAKAFLFPRGVALGNASYLPYAIAASLESKIQVRQDGCVWEQVYQTGKPTGPLTQIRTLESDESTGNTFTFTLDPAVFDRGDEISYADLAVNLREIASFIPGLRISLRDERQNPILEHEFFYPGGLADLIRHLNRDCLALHDVIHQSDVIELQLQKHHYEPYAITIDFAIQFSDCAVPFQLSYQSFHETRDGGLHIDSLRRAVCDAIRTVASDRKLAKPFDDIDLLRGMTAAIRVEHPMPQYAGCIQNRLVNPDLRVVETSVYLAVEDFFSRDPDALQRVLTRESTRVLPVKERRYGEFAAQVKYDRMLS